MADTATAVRYDPFVAFRFEVSIDNPEGATMGGFSECTGLQLETEFHTYAEGGTNTHMRMFPTRTKQSNIVLKKGLVNRALWDWYDRMVQGDTRRLTGTIRIKDPANTKVVAEWQFYNALPAKWHGPDLNAQQNNVAVETLEIVYEGLKRA